MEMKNNRIIQIVKILSRTKKMVTGEKLCQVLNVTSRTLRNDLKQYKSTLNENGIEIISRHGVGYQLHISNEAKYYQFIEKTMKEESQNQLVIPIYPEDRIQYLIRKLLTQEEYIKIEDLCEEIFVSRSTLTNDLKEVKQRLQYFRLDIESKPAHGIKVIGSEFHKRSCISQYFFHVDGTDNSFLDRAKASSPKQEEIAQLLYETMVDEVFKLTDIGFQNLVIHIMIALLRLEEKITSDSITYENHMLDTKEYQMSKVLCKKLEEKFQVTFPDIEQYYIALHLSGKKAMQYTSSSRYLNNQNEKLLQQIFDSINQRYQMNLSTDIELYTSLALHFQPMMNRLKYGMNIQNPLLKQIKQENIEAFEISIQVAHIIEEETTYIVSENEIGYIALHFALAIERYRNQTTKKNVIIVCASGMGSSQILLHKVRQKFKDSIENIYVTELYELPSIKQEEFDFILSTVPITFETRIPTIHVQYFLDDQDSYHIQEAILISDEKLSFVDKYFNEQLFFTDLIGKSKEEIIHQMCIRTNKIKDLPNNFEEEVIRREMYSATEFGNSIAMPHTMHPMTKETFVSVGILQKPIKWQNQTVKFVFLLCIKENSQEALGLFHEALSALVLDKNALSLLEKEPTINKLKEILKSLASKEKENDIDVLFM
ncbi:MAG: BglG family transcription antiterminator [Coprobacillaceae bacterium]